MHDSLRQLMQARLEMLDFGQFEEIAAQYTLPLVLFMNEQQIVISTREELESVLSRMVATRKETGIAQVVASISAVDIPRNGRFRVWVRYSEVDAHGITVGQTDALHYCRHTPTGVKSEMVEVGQCRLPEIWESAVHLAVQNG